MTMIERAARAIAEELRQQEPAHGGTYFVDTTDLRNATIDGKFDLYGMARAVLAAVRDEIDNCGMVEGARLMVEREGSGDAQIASDAYDGVIDLIDAAIIRPS